ncbi:erg24, C-14 sterol reductase [Ceratobasidium sp. 392]|nr:erg24, C-14 sterol reductase [Ceratobasidium sp. 392]
MATSVVRNPRTTHYEFFGPPGAAIVSIGVPIGLYALYFTCNEASGGCPPPLWALPFNFVRAVESLDWWASLFDVKATAAYFAWGSNNEKNDFRNGKNPKNLTSFQTERGTRLLTSGWWGMCQHPNYLGDLIMALSYSLPTGFNTPITYFYPIYFLILLLHRQNRDSEACEKKYGKDWKTYTNIVPWKIFPYVY